MFKVLQVFWFMHAVYINVNFWILQIVFNRLEPTEQFFKKNSYNKKPPSYNKLRQDIQYAS